MANRAKGIESEIRIWLIHRKHRLLGSHCLLLHKLIHLRHLLLSGLVLWSLLRKLSEALESWLEALGLWVLRLSIEKV